MTNPESIEAEHYFLAIADTTNDMIHLNDSEGRILYANHATETMLGYQLHELINTNAAEIVHPDDRETIKNDMAAISRDKQLPSRDIRLLKKDGSYIEVEVRGFIVALAEQKYIGAIIRDITSRKSAERGLETYRDSLEKLVEERTRTLQKALDEIKTLAGILPICSFCKKIRDDQGYWNQVEDYVRKHSKAEFSHGFCPECAEKHYPDCVKKQK